MTESVLVENKKLAHWRLGGAEDRLNIPGLGNTEKNDVKNEASAKLTEAKEEPIEKTTKPIKWSLGDIDEALERAFRDG